MKKYICSICGYVYDEAVGDPSNGIAPGTKWEDVPDDWACNTLPGLLSGFIQNPQDAFLYGRINDGNVASLSLGLGFGWLGELNLEYTIEKLFDGQFGIGYPKEDAERKRKAANQVKQFNLISKRDITDVMNELDEDLINKVVSKTDAVQYIINNSNEKKIVEYLSKKNIKQL